jgi:hypothetical protein
MLHVFSDLLGNNYVYVHMYILTNRLKYMEPRFILQTRILKYFLSTAFKVKAFLCLWQYGQLNAQLKDLV